MIRALCYWAVGCVLVFLALVWTSCGPKSAPAEPASVDEASWCYAAVLGGVETLGCAEVKPACDAARAAAYEAGADGDSISEDCYPVRLRLDRAANP